MTEATVTTNRYIQAFLSETQARENALRERRVKMEGGIEKFKANCQVWLGDLWDEIEPGEFGIEWASDVDAIFQFYFKWNGLAGKITDGLWRTDVKGASRVAEAIIIIVNDGAGWHHTFDLNAKMQMLPEYEMEAAAPDELQFGQYLCEVVQKKQWLESVQAEDAEKAKKMRLAQYFLDFENWFPRNLTREDIQKKVEQAVAEFPDHEVELRGTAREALKRIGEMEDEKRKKQQRREEEDAEEQRLEELARSMFEPMFVYEVRYCQENLAMFESPLEKTAFCLSTEKDAEDWWNEIQPEGIICRVAFGSVLSVTERRIESISDPLASLLYRRQRITSEKFPEITVWALIRPDSMSN